MPLRTVAHVCTQVNLTNTERLYPLDEVYATEMLVQSHDDYSAESDRIELKFYGRRIHGRGLIAWAPTWAASH